MPPRMLLLAGLTVGCGGAAPPAPPMVAPSSGADCRLTSDSADRTEMTGARPVILAAAAPGDTVLVSPARRWVPIGLSCVGLPVPRLASAWSADSARRSWTLVVPSPAALATRWRSRAEAAAALRHAGVTSVVPIDDHRLTVNFRTPQDTVPPLFADPALALRPETGDPDAIRLLPPTDDLRDALDQGADLVITGSPEVLDYGTSRGYGIHTLPWSRTYVLLLAGDGTLPIRSAEDSAAFRADLAGDAVRVPARGAEPPYRWQSAGCAQAAAPPSANRTVAYSAGDPVARALAERIVAVAGTLGVARGVPEPELRAGLARGLAGAYVLALPRSPTVPCRELGGLPVGASAVPLIDTRATALLRRGVPPLVVDHDGGLVPERVR